MIEFTSMGAMATEDAQHTDASASSGRIRSFKNDPANFLAESLGGLVNHHPAAEWRDEGFLGQRTPIVTKDGKPAVAVISGGGSGHEPMHAGFLGEGMLNAVCPGLLFTSPNAVQITEATNWADQGAGVLHIVKNYTGDVMNFKVARQGLEGEVETESVLVADDVATALSSADDSDSDTDSNDDGPGRRGTAATILVEKVCGAAAYRGDDLASVAAIGREVAENSASMAAALAPGYLPTSGKDTFDLTAGSMEVGVGIHGERGVSREETTTADSIVDRLLEPVVEDLGLGDGDGVILVVNGLGGTTDLELNLIFGQALQWLADKHIIPVRSMVGTFVTSVNMHGVSLTLTKASSEVVELLDAPTQAPAWPKSLGTGTEFSAAHQVFEEDLPDEGEENEWLTAVVERIQNATDDLTELDRLAGDGDFGQNMDAAFGSVDLPLKGEDTALLDGLAHRLFVRAGGTSGAVLGTMFREMARGMDGSDNSPKDRIAGLNKGLSAAVEAVRDLGGAKPGDNTLVDALVPAAEKLAEIADSAESFEDALEQTYKAAEEGALSTREMVATKGRASYLGDASKGVVDPGAILVSWLFGGTGQVSDFTE